MRDHTKAWLPSSVTSDGAPRRNANVHGLRVALVTSSYNHIRDGVALTLNRLVDYLERHGVKVLVFAPVAGTPALTHCGDLVPVPSIPLPMRPEYRLVLGLPRSLERQLLDFRPDIIHIAVPDLLGFRALRLAKERKIPVVGSYHTRYETYFKHYWYIRPFTRPAALYLRWFWGACREVYVPSPSMAEMLLAEGFRNNFQLWPRGVDSDRFNPAKRSSDWRARYGIGEGEFVVLHVARLVREKRLDTVIAAARRLEAGGTACRFVFVGDGPERKTMEAQLPRAIFTGSLEGEELSMAYASADVFVFASETESFGNVTLEAMASGLPCVCADATGSRSLVVAEQTGYLVSPGSAEGFASRIATLAADPALRRQMSEAARLRSLAFSWDDAMARILGHYEDIVSEPGVVVDHSP